MMRMIHPLGLLVSCLVSVAAMVAVEMYVVVEDGSHVAPRESFELPQPVARNNPKFEFLAPKHNHPLIAEFNIGEQRKAALPAPKPVLKAKAPLYTLKNPHAKKARIAIIIDDMGMNYPMTRAMSGIEDVPLTLAFLPYAGNLERATQRAKDNGHELIIHMPMEPMDSSISTGPIAVRDNMDRAQVDAMLKQAFDAFGGYTGVNNHMGSRVTQDREKMAWVMDALKKRDLFYVDSKTINSSIAADVARDSGLDYAERDVFLDHEESPEFVRSALEKAERIAMDQGYAIAIGHPKKVTYDGLRQWLPSLEARGFEIVPVSELLYSPAPNLAQIEVSAGDDSVEENEAEVEEVLGGLYSLNP